MHIHCGVFEAESHWREKDLATLPFLADAASARITAAMDELLFVFCEPGDKLLTTHSMDGSHFEYLRSVGFAFDRNEFNLVAEQEQSESPSVSVYGDICTLAPSPELRAYLTKAAILQPFAVTPGIIEFAQRLDLPHSHLPSCDVVRRVNTKSYGLMMRNHLELNHGGVVSEGMSSFIHTGTTMLAKGPLLVKDEYGVSGKGNHLITNAGALDRLAKHLAKQQAGGKRVKFVMEPFLTKSMDFSCQFHVSKEGGIEVFCVQRLDNQGLGFGRSRTPDKALAQMLDNTCYSDIIHNIGETMVVS